MLFRKVQSNLLRRVQRSMLHNSYQPPSSSHESTRPTHYDWIIFINSFTNCILVCSVLWGFEQYNEKLKTIENTTRKTDEILVTYRLLERKCTKKNSETTKHFS